MKTLSKKEIFLGLIIIFILFLAYKLPKLFVNTQIKQIPEVKLKEKVKKDKLFAIMISEDGSNYKENKSNVWPNDKYKFKEAKCVDNEGNIINDIVTFENGKATLKTNKTVYCTLYFDHKETIEILREADKNNNLSSILQGGMNRYQGIDNVANWICFGTEENCGTNDDNIDKYMYRIIGITEEGQMYVLKETYLKESNTDTFSWNKIYGIKDCLGEACEWPNADLYKRINGISNGTSTGYSGNTNIFLGTNEYPSYYEYLNDKTEWYNLIEEHNWMYGDTNNRTDSIRYNGDAIYAIETGKTSTKRYWPDEGQETCSNDSPCTEKDYTWSKSISAKIGLMYMHDVNYAYIGGNLESTTNVKNSWIFYQKDGYNTSTNYEWLITRVGLFCTSCTTVGARYNSSIYVLGFDSTLSLRSGVRPVFYLSSTAQIVDGNGTKTNPFIIDITE